jgi:hypothetical protein
MKKKRKTKQKQLSKFLLTLIAILIFILITLKQFSNETFGIKDIQTMIGTEYSGGKTLTVREHLILRAVLDSYVQHIHSGDVDKAYGVLLPKYKEIVSKDVFSEAIKTIGYENFEIQSAEIEQLTEKMVAFHTTIKNDNKLEILLILDGERYYIIPEPFLEHKTVDKHIKKKGVKYTLKDYQVYVDSCIFNMSFENTKNEIVEIAQIKMKNQTGGTYTAANGKITLQPNETKNISVVVETRLDFPKSLQLIRVDNEKARVYTFELD